MMYSYRGWMVSLHTEITYRPVQASVCNNHVCILRDTKQIRSGLMCMDAGGQSIHKNYSNQPVRYLNHNQM